VIEKATIRPSPGASRHPLPVGEGITAPGEGRKRATRSSIVSLAACLVLIVAVFELPAASSRFNVLVFTKTAGFHHDSIPAGIQAIRSLGLQYGFDVDDTADGAAFTDGNLSRYRVVVFLNTTGDILDLPQQAALEHFIQRGGGFVGIHSAADTEYDWPWYGRLLGAYFVSHPDIQSATLRVADASHPSTESLPREWIRTDEWYNFRELLSPDIGVLLTIDERSYSGGEMGGSHPISWRHPYEGGRAWYTAMGHTIESYSEPSFLVHIAEGIVWTAGVQALRAAPLPIRDVELGNIRNGYVVFTPNTGSALPGTSVTFGMVSNGEVKSQAGVIGLSLTTDASLFVELNSAINRNVGVAVANPAGNAASLTMMLRDSSGLASGNPVVLTLPAHQQLTKFVSEIFQGVSPEDFTGSLRIQSSSPVSILGLRFSGILFSTLPVVNLAGSPATTSAVFPQFALGGGWATQLALLNDTASAVSGRFDVFDGSGNPMSVTMNGFNRSSYTYSILPGGAFVFAPRDANGQSPM
jgi:type 1 glutamine amidotransferase